eukprot:s85_g9.t1
MLGDSVEASDPARGLGENGFLLPNNITSGAAYRRGRSYGDPAFFGYHCPACRQDLPGHPFPIRIRLADVDKEARKTCQCGHPGSPDLREFFCPQDTESFRCDQSLEVHSTKSFSPQSSEIVGLSGGLRYGSLVACGGGALSPGPALLS